MPVPWPSGVFCVEAEQLRSRSESMTKAIPPHRARSWLVILGLWVSGAALAAAELPPLNDPPTGIELPGKFTWFDLATPAIARQQVFYGAVFGWSFRMPGRSDDQYSLIMNQGRAIGGMFQHEPPGGEQDGAVWIALLSVEDPDAAANMVLSRGGKVEIPASNVSRRGRHALFRDPAGSLFGVLRSSTGDPEDAEVDVGDILWVDLFARDVGQMTEFYRALAPFEVSSQTVVEDVSRTLLSAHGMPRAGIVPVDEEANRAAWVPYVRVEDVEATLEKVVEGGGFTIIAPDERLLDGNLAVFVDPNGGVTGIVKWEYAEGVEP